MKNWFKGLIIGICFPFAIWFLLLILSNFSEDSFLGIFIYLIFPVCLITGFHGHPAGCQILSIIVSPIIYGILGLLLGLYIPKLKKK